jgi:hypothetical protein
MRRTAMQGWMDGRDLRLSMHDIESATQTHIGFTPFPFVVSLSLTST